MTHTHAHDTQATIAHLSQTLKAPRINTVYATIAEQARAESYTYEEYLAAVLSVEATARAESGARQRVKRAGFPAVKTIADFDFSAQPGIDRADIARLETGAWVATAENVVLLGPPAPEKHTSPPPWASPPPSKATEYCSIPPQGGSTHSPRHTTPDDSKPHSND